MDSLSFKNNYWTYYSVACCSPNLSREDSCKAFTVTAILTAATGGLFFIVMLIIYGCSVDPLALHHLPNDVSKDRVESLLKQGASFKTKDTYEFTPLMSAIESGDLKKAKTFVECGAPLGRTTIRGIPHTPLHAAIWPDKIEESLELIDALIKGGASLTETGLMFEDTPLGHALTHKAPKEIIEKLIGDGAVLSKTDKLGCLPIYKAITLGASWDIINLVIPPAGCIFPSRDGNYWLLERESAVATAPGTGGAGRGRRVGGTASSIPAKREASHGASGETTMSTGRGRRVGGTASGIPARGEKLPMGAS